MNERFKDEVDKVIDELSNMTDEEFNAELEKHMDGDICQALMYAWEDHESGDRK